MFFIPLGNSYKSIGNTRVVNSAM